MQASTADPFWMHFVVSIQDLSANATADEELSKHFTVFRSPHLASSIDCMPEFIATGMKHVQAQCSLID